MALRSLTPLALALAGGLLCAGPGAAASFTSFWSLGDSLSDPGNLYAATGGTTPQSPPYFEGRFSNGPVWAEHVADRFAAKGLDSGNVAYGRSFAVRAPGDPVPGLAQQVGLFALTATGHLGKRPVASIWSGANDLIFDGIPNGTAVAAGERAASAVAMSAIALSAFGVHDVALFSMPDLSKVPLYALSGDAVTQARAQRGSAAFNRALDWQVPKLETLGINVIRIDTAGHFERLIDDPEAFGVKNATTPCLLGALPCSTSEAMERAFFDPVHPNAIIHEQIAAAVSEKIAPVPVPLPLGLLLGAAALLVVLPRKRREA